MNDRDNRPPSSRGLGHTLFMRRTGVRIPLGVLPALLVHVVRFRAELDEIDYDLSQQKLTL